MNFHFKRNPDIIIVDDHLIFRQGIKAIINYEDIGTVIGEASNGEEFIELLLKTKPDLVLMDIDMPNMNGFEATRKALEILPNLKIIGFTVFDENDYYNRMFELGAKGFILKSSGFVELEKAISVVMNGEKYFSGKFQNETNKNIREDELVDPNENDSGKQNRKSKMLLFPWTVNNRHCVIL